MRHMTSCLVDVPVRTSGDAHARAQVRIAEIDASIALIQRFCCCFPMARCGRLRAAAPIRRGSAGRSRRAARYFMQSISTVDGRLARVKIKSPSFSNWRVFPLTVHDSNMMDYAINEASFGLTVAGCDR